MSEKHDTQPPGLPVVEAGAGILVAQAVAQGKGETVMDPDTLRRVSEIVEEVDRQAAA